MSDLDIEDAGIVLDGVKYTVSDLSFKEQRAMRVDIRELAPNNDEVEASLADVVPAFIRQVMLRSNPGFSLDEAQEFKPSDLVPPTNGKAAKK
jgi:hypothetical protein